MARPSTPVDRQLTHQFLSTCCAAVHTSCQILTHAAQQKSVTLRLCAVLRKQALELGLRWAVEAVGALFQSVTILHGYAAARRFNQALAFKGLQRAGYAGPANPDHQGDKLVRE